MGQKDLMRMEIQEEIDLYPYPQLLRSRRKGNIEQNTDFI